VRAVKILSERPYFEELSFSFYGEGALFQEITKEISGYSNVFLHNTFLSQEEIVKAHALNGVFLCPTRFDSQGVSMCEAMASGLVPISTRVASIPEFVQHSETGLLGEPESAVEIANMIERLYFNPELFKTISQNAAESVRLQCGIDATLGREMELIQS
jgi:glycosyltransferase involved in cell wall biosynthesis